MLSTFDSETRPIRQTPSAYDRPLRGDPGGAQRRCARHGAQRRRVAAAARRRPGGAGPADAAGMQAALATALRSGEPGSGIAVAVPAHLLLAGPRAAAEWWPALRSGTVRMVSIGAEEGALDGQLLAHLWQAGVAAGHIALEELAALLCWQPARLLGLPAKGRLHPGCDADLAVLDPEAPAPRDEQEGAQPGAAEGAADGTESGEATGRRGAVVRVLRGGEDAAARPGRWIRATPVREPL